MCILSAPCFNRSGYGDWSTDIAKSLLRYGKYDIKIAPQRWGNCQSKQFLNELTDPEEIAIRSRFLTSNRLDKQPDIYIGMSIPNEFQAPAKFNIGMTAGIETTISSGEFIEGVNRVDLTIALSEHAKTVFDSTVMTKQHPDGKTEEIRVKKPIEVCFWGADTGVFNNTPNTHDNVNVAMDRIKEDFAFLFVGQWTNGSLFGDRKDIGNLVKTFCTAFKSMPENQRPCLILKTAGATYSTVDRYKMLENITIIKDSIGDGCPNVYLMHGELEPSEMNAFINHDKVKCHVSFTHGEGYGHPLLLQTLSGKPLLVPEWSGHLDFINREYGEFLPGKLNNIPKQAVNKWLLKESQWFDVAYNLAEEKFKSMFRKATGDRCLSKSEKLRVENADKFSLDKMDEKLWSILEKHVPTYAAENKFVLPQLKPVGATTPQKLTLPKLKFD